jgi:hypothetical protein
VFSADGPKFIFLQLTIVIHIHAQNDDQNDDQVHASYDDVYGDVCGNGYGDGGDLKSEVAVRRQVHIQVIERNVCLDSRDTPPFSIIIIILR